LFGIGILQSEILVYQVGQDGILRPIGNRPLEAFRLIASRPINNRPQDTIPLWLMQILH
jgi:hypothetical protein